ncbi:MAG: hypothetical protein KDK37_06490 [Leptospiraceae bacterium]|nr:hypothetical protein [Leptospiraceae bacterium]
MNRSILRNSFRTLVFTSTLLLSLSAANCSGDGETLATYKGGEITRGEMRLLVEASGAPSTEISTAQQNEILKLLGTYRLAALEMADDADAQKWLKENGSLLERKALLRAFQAHLNQEEPFEIMSMQLAILRKNKDTSRKEEADALAKKLNDLSSDEEIEDLLMQASESNETKMNGGRIVPHCISCQPNPLEFLTKPLQEASEGKFIVVDAEGAYFVARRLSLDKLDGDELAGFYQKYFMELAKNRSKDAKQKIEPSMIEAQAKQYADRMVRSQKASMQKLVDHVEKLEKDHTFKQNQEEINLESFDGKHDDTWLIEIDGKKRTIADFKKTMNTEGFDAPTLLQIIQNIYIPSELLMASDVYEDVKGSDLYKFLVEHNKNEALAGRYIQKQTADLQVTDAQVEEYYNLRKFNEFKGKPLGSVKEQIRQQLRQTQGQTAVQKIRDDLFKKYEFKIDREKLKADEI